MIKVVYFASIRERLGCDQEQLDALGVGSVAELLAQLQGRGGVWQEVLAGPALLVAVNQQMATREQALQDGDEVAFFPPVTGG